MENNINLEIFTKFPIIETERLLLREYKTSDLETMFHIKSDPGLLEFMDKEPHKDLEETTKLQELIDRHFKEKKGINWVIVDKSTNEPIGDVGIWRLDYLNARGEIGYVLSSNHQGKGIMTEALKAVIGFGFKKLQLHSIEANINTKNVASRKLLQKCHFRKEALFSENYYFRGEYLDSEIYSLLEKWTA